jgi:hypothetical protein
MNVDRHLYLLLECRLNVICWVRAISISNMSIDTWCFFFFTIRASSHGVPSEPRSIRAILAVESMVGGLTTSHGVPSPNSQIPSMTWMHAWQHYLEARLGTCVESRAKQKTRSNFMVPPRVMSYELWSRVSISLSSQAQLGIIHFSLCTSYHFSVTMSQPWKTSLREAMKLPIVWASVKWSCSKWNIKRIILHETRDNSWQTKKIVEDP